MLKGPQNENNTPIIMLGYGKEIQSFEPFEHINLEEEKTHKGSFVLQHALYKIIL
jgi:hypothetical protein